MLIRRIFLKLIIFLTLHFCSLQSNAQNRQIESQTRQAQTLFVRDYFRTDGDSANSGSFQGGTSITISGLGFDKNSLQNNKVFFGNYPCQVLQATREQIICQTTSYFNFTDYSENLQLKVIVGGSSSIISSGRIFRYAKQQTPVIRNVYPSTVYDTAQIKIWGMHTIYKIGDGRQVPGQSFKIMIGNTACGRTGYNYEILSTYYYTFLTCTLDNNLEAGKYNISHWVSSGYAHHQQELLNKNIHRNQSYEIVILPTINKISPASGTGQILTINGTGFTNNMSRVKVMVDGRICEVRQSDINKVQCRLNQRRVGPTSRLQTNSTNLQISGFISGSGWNYSRYSFYFDGQIKNIRNITQNINFTNTLQKQTIKAVLSTGSYQTNSQFVDIYKGYFKAPRSGRYIFKAFADQKFALFISKSYGTAQISLNQTPIIYSNQITGNTSHSLFPKYKIISQPFYMQQGKYYYMQLYHSCKFSFFWYNGDTYSYQYNRRGGYLQVSVNIPNSNPSTIPGQVYPIHQFRTVFTPDPQIIQFVQQGATGGYINLALIRLNDNFQTIYSYSMNIAYNASIDIFINAIKSCSGYSQYQLQGTRTVYDITGNNITDVINSTTQPYKYVWRININRLRTQQHRNQYFDITYHVDGDQYFTQTTLQNYSSFITGTFSINFNGVTLSYLNTTTRTNITQFPYNIQASTIQQILQKITPAFKYIKVTRDGQPNYGANWTIFYNKITVQPPYPTFDTSNLQGGRSGTSPTIQMNTLQTYQTDLFIKVIDHSFMYTASDKPKVLITIDDNLVSACKQQTLCNYQYSQTAPKVTNIGYSNGNPLVNFTVNVSSGYNVNITSIQIKQKNSGSLCMITSNQVLPTFRCFLQTNQDLSPHLYAGPVIFQVFATGVGYIQVVNTNFNYPLSVTSINPNQGSKFGGYNVTISGRGFHQYNTSLINITICNQRVQILQASIIRVIVQLPSCPTSGNTTIYISSNNISTNSTFQYQDPPPTQIPVIINTITPSSLNPTIKQVLKINGSNFGNYSSMLTVSINRDDGKKLYKLKILKVNDTYMEVGFPGSLQGRYKFSIKKINGTSVTFSQPASANIDILKIGVFVYSVQPSTGSPYGGTQIIINGQNFSTQKLDNLINIGQRSNTLCQITFINSTQIHCRTPQQPSSYSNTSQTVYVTTKITQDSICMNLTNGCFFAYTDISAYSGPQIINITKTEYNLSIQNITLITNNISLWPIGYQVVIRNLVTDIQHIIITPITRSNDTTLIFLLPDIQSGLYSIFIRTNFGHSNSFDIKRGFTLTTTSFVSTLKGGVMTINGIGLPQNIDSIFKFTYIFSDYPASIKYTILQTNPKTTSLLITPPSSPQNIIYGILKIQGPFNTQSISITFTTTGTINDVLTYTPTTSGNITFSLTNTSYVTKLRIISKLNVQIYYDILQWNRVSNKINFTQVLTAGAYYLWVNFNSTTIQGWYQVNTQINITRSNVNLSGSIKLGKNGALLALPNMNGILGNNSRIKINGQIGSFYKSQGTNSYYYLPPFIQKLPTTTASTQPSPTPSSTNIRNRNIIDLLRQSNYQHSYISDTIQYNSHINQATFDNDRRNSYRSNQTNCYIGINITSSGVGIKLQQIYMEISDQRRQNSRNITFQGSIDGINWYNIISKLPNSEQSMRSRYSLRQDQYQQQDQRRSSIPAFISNTTITQRIFKAIRAKDVTGASRCIADYIAFKGQLIILNTTNTTPSTNTTEVGPYSLQIDDGFNLQTISNIITYSDLVTPTVTSVSPKTGHFLGGYNLTIKGTNLQGNANVTIDTIPCLILQNNSTTIICAVQQRPDIVPQIYFQILINSSYAILGTNNFKYVMRWSDQKTWGMSFKPIDGDLIYVPKGQTLWVDQSTPKLAGIVVQGKIIFSDQIPMTITTDFIIVNRGQFVAGTVQNPYINLLTFQLTGGKQTPRQPIYGTKFIGCQSCKFSMIGKGLSNVRWTKLNNTVLPNTNTIYPQIPILDMYSTNLTNTKFVLTSTTNSHRQTQLLTISNIQNGNIYTQQSLSYKHLSTYINNTKISSQIGLLNSNIIIKGIDNYAVQQFGAKLIYRGQQAIDNSYFQISNIEITKCGQPHIYNQHCITILSTGTSSNSYIKNSSIYSTYSRGIQLANYLNNFIIQNNVLYNTNGHSIQIQNIYSSNIIKNNLIITPKPSWLITQKDSTPANIHIYGPMNIITNNYIAGGQYIGIWYDLQNSRQNSNCGWGLKYNNKSINNYIHSMNLYGVLINKINYGRYSCNTNLIQQSYTLTFTNHIFYMNYIGLYIVQSNNLIVSYCKFIQNYIHYQIYNSRLGYNSSSLINTQFYGILDINNNNTNAYNMAQTFIQLPCSSGFTIRNISFNNINNINSSLLSSCIPIDNYWYYNTDQVFISQIRYNNVTAQTILMNFDKLLIVYDTDGTFTNNSITRTRRMLYSQRTLSKTIVANFSYLQDNACISRNKSQTQSGLFWNNLLVCNSSIKIRKISINYYTQQGWYYSFKIGRLTNFTSPNNTIQWKQLYYYRGNTVQIPVIMNRYYQIYNQRYTQCDYRYIAIKYTGIYQLYDGSIILRHNYQLNRQFYQVKQLYNGMLITNINQTNTQISLPFTVQTCNYGDYYHDNNKHLFGICISDKLINTTNNPSISIQPIYCRYDCPTPSQRDNNGCNVQQQSRIRVWSNVSMWPNGRLPIDGQNVTIKAQWKVLLDVQPAKMDIFIIQGTLIIPDVMNVTVIQANLIWVKGTLKAGNTTVPYMNQLIIKINGNMSSMPLVIDNNDQGNKMLIVTGTLSLYGKPPTTTWSYLTSTVYKTNTTISVTNCSDWKIGDQLVIGPTFTNSTHTQYITITNIYNNIITFTPPLNYTHYGSSSPIIKNGLTVDTRAAVGHLTRNIKITSGNNITWGYRIITYGYSQCNSAKFGILRLIGVQMMNGGQPYPITSNKPKPAIHLKRLTTGTNKCQISSCSIHHCNSRCMLIQSGKNIKVYSNVLSSASYMHIQITGISANLQITNNLMIDAHQIPYNIYSLYGLLNSFYMPVSCFEWKSQIYKSTSTNSIISNNLCQGSQGAGYSRYFQKCDKVSDTIYYNNSVNSADIGYLLHSDNPYPCVQARYLIASSCKIGIFGTPRSTSLTYTNVVILDSIIGIALRTVAKSTDITSYIKNSHISIFSKQDCLNCYKQQIGYQKCSQMSAVNLFVSTQQYPYSTQLSYYQSDIYRSIKLASYDAKSYIINTTFANYRMVYNSSINNTCNNNRILSTIQTATQLIGSQHFYNSICNNCHLQSIIKFINPINQSSCGQFQCTGQYNYYIQDNTGHLFNGLVSIDSNINTEVYTGRFMIPGGNNMSIYLGVQSNLVNRTNIGWCQYINQSNGYICGGEYKFYVMEFQSIGTDYQSSVTWPVEVSTFNMSYWEDTYYNYNWFNTSNTTTNTTNSTNTTTNTTNTTTNTTTNATNTTNNTTNTTNTTTNPYDTNPPPQPNWISKLNAYKQWSYNSITGLSNYNRLNRFISLILANDSYNITFASTPPRDMRFQFQRRQLSSSTTSANTSFDYAIIKIYYPIPNSVRVQVNNTIIQPITHLQNNIQNPLLNMTNICGANKYYFKHRTLDFVLNSNPSCRPRITITNSIQLTAKFNMDIDAFYTMDGKTQFIDRMAALLGITDRSRIKVVGIYRGSVNIQSFVQDNNVVPQDNANNANYSQQASDITTISQTINRLYSSGQLQSALMSAGFGQVIIFNSNVRLYDQPLNPSSTTQQANTQETVIDSKTLNIALIIGISVGSVVIIILVGCLIYLKRKNKIANQIMELQMSDLKRLAKVETQPNNSLVIVDLE